MANEPNVFIHGTSFCASENRKAGFTDHYQIFPSIPQIIDAPIFHFNDCVLAYYRLNSMRLRLSPTLNGNLFLSYAGSQSDRPTMGCLVIYVK